MKSNTIGDLLAHNVHRLLLVRGWTQAELGLRMGITGGVVSRMLSRNYVPTGATLATLSKVLEVAPHELLLPAAGLGGVTRGNLEISGGLVCERGGS